MTHASCKGNYIDHSYFHKAVAKQRQGKEALLNCINELEGHEGKEGDGGREGGRRYGGELSKCLLCLEPFFYWCFENDGLVKKLHKTHETLSKVNIGFHKWRTYKFLVSQVPS
jgi:hypothetical protein